MEGILYASREMELVKVFARRSVEQSFPTTRVLGYQNRVTKSLSREETRFPRPTAYIRGRSLKRGDFILFSVSRVRFAVYYGNASRTREVQRCKAQIVTINICQMYFP